MLALLLSIVLVSTDSTGRAPESTGDQLYVQLRYEEALRAYERELSAAPGNPALLWRMARVHIAMGEVAEGKEKEEHYRSAERYARESVRADSLQAPGHSWLAAALGNIAFYEGSRTKVRLANDIRRELDVAIALDSTDDIAWSILGSFYRALGNVSWIERQLANVFLGSLPEGGYEEAEVALQRATTLAPTVIRHRFELALLYTDWDRPELARASLERCLTLPVQVASDRRVLARASKMLEEMKDHR
jgi:tetratricopeptide (TPR) repeat protein